MLLLGLCACLKAPLFLSSALLHRGAPGSNMLVPQQWCTPHGRPSGSNTEIGSVGQQGNLGFCRGVSDKFFTHLLDCTVVVAADAVHVVGEVEASDVKAVLCAILVWCCGCFEWPLMFEQPPFVCWHNHSNFIRCLSKRWKLVFKNKYYSVCEKISHCVTHTHTHIIKQNEKHTCIKHMIDTCEPVHLFTIKDDDEDPSLIWTILMHHGTYIGTNGMIFAVCIGVYCFNPFACTIWPDTQPTQHLRVTTAINLN